MSKRVLSLVLALVMVLGAFSTVFAAETVNEKVEWLKDKGLVVGDAGTGDLRLADPIKRSEVAVMVVKALDLEAVANASAAFPSIFKDMSPLHWANGFVNTAAGRGFISGYPDGNFAPDNNVNYAEMASMLVRVEGSMTVEEQAKAVWPTTWLAKAVELGIFDGVTVANYNEPATRENVFNMVYNVIVNKAVGNYSIVKGIVLENYRVETLAKDEVVVELVNILQKADFVEESRAEKGDQIDLVIPAKVGDVEDLLGKVADFTLDKDGKVVAVKVDNTYKYLVGELEFDTRRVTVDETRYTVELPERYRTNQSDERIFRTYVNNEAFAYEDVTVNKAEFAKVTVKNGKVLFIDAFEAFDDIAPVAKDIDSRNRVTFYDDAAAGDTDVITVSDKAYVLNYVDGKVTVGSNKDIKANDVIHWILNSDDAPYIVFVRPLEDAAVEGEFKDARTPRAGQLADVYMKVEDTYYPGFINEEPRNLVFSYYAQEGEFDVLGNDFLDVLEDFEKEEVILLLDMFGNIQSLSTETEILASAYALIADVWGTEFRLLLADNTKDWFETDRSTKLTGGDTRELRLGAYVAGSLVKAYADEDNLLSEARLFRNTDDDVFVGVEDVTNSAVTLADGYKFVNKNTVVFLNIEAGKEVAMTLANFVKNYDLGDDLDGYVAVAPRDAELAEAIVITAGATLKGSAKGDTVYGKVGYVGRNFLELQNNNTRFSATSTQLTGLRRGDIVAVVLEKDSETKVKEIYDPFDEVEVDDRLEGYVVAGITFDGTNRGRIVDTDGNEYRIDDAQIFDSYRRGDDLTIVVNDKNNVLFLKKGEYVAPELKDFTYTGELALTDEVPGEVKDEEENVIAPVVTDEADAVVADFDIATATAGVYTFTYSAEGYNDLVVTVTKN